VTDSDVSLPGSSYLESPPYRCKKLTRGACWPAGLAAGYRNPRSPGGPPPAFPSLRGARGAPRSP